MPIASRTAFRFSLIFCLLSGWMALSVEAVTAWAPGGSAGGDGVWDATTENWLDGAATTAFPALGDALFEGAGGTVDVDGDVEAGALEFTVPGYTLSLDNGTGDHLIARRLSGLPQIAFSGLINAGADSYPSIAELRAVGLEFQPEGDQELKADVVSVLGGSPVIAVSGDGGAVRFGGRWLANTGSVISWLRLDEGGQFGLTESADMNFIKEGFFTLQLWVTGDGSGTLELEEGFVADRTDGGLEQKGIGSIRIGAGTLISHRSANLPLGYRPRSDGSAQTNGHLVFENRSGNRWIVRGEDQVYPGAVWIFKGMELVTERNLTHVGITEGSSNYTAQNGWSVLNSVTVTKKGSGKLTLAGEQSYAPGAILDVVEGTLAMASDPATGQSLYGDVRGAQLTLQVGAGARTEWNTDGTLQSLFMSGDLFIRGRLGLDNGGFAQFGEESRTEILLEESVSGPWIQATGPVFAGGQLVVTRLPEFLPEAGTEWIVCEAVGLIGSWTLDDRTGLDLQLVQDADTLKLVAGKGAPDLPGKVILEDTFEQPQAFWDDLSTVPLWGSPPTSGTAFEWADGSVRLRRSGSRSTSGYTSYSSAVGLKTFVALDHRFAEPVPHAASELTVDFRLRWPFPGDGSGEGGRVLILLNHDYPEGGLDLTPEGSAGSRWNDFSAEWWARPAYHVRLRNSTTRAGSSMLQYGGGMDAQGEYERTGSWWLPGFVSGAGQLAPGAGDDFPVNSWVRTREGMARDTFTSFRYRILPDRQELWRDDNDDGILGPDELKATMPLPADSSAPLYQYFDTFEGLRVFWNGVDDGAGDFGQMELDWLRVIHQENLSPRADAGEDRFAQVLVDGLAPVTLDASGSSYPDSAELFHVWSRDGEILQAGRSPVMSVQLPVGEHELELLVLDGSGNFSSDTCRVSVTLGRARPVPETNGDQSVTAENPWYGLVFLSAVGSFSPNGEIVDYRWSTGVPERILQSGPGASALIALGMGSHQVKLTLTDDQGLSTETSVRVIVDPPDSGAESDVIYRENFSRPSTGGELGPEEVGWNLMRFDGDPVARIKYDGNAHRSLAFDRWDTGPYLPQVNANPSGSELDGPATYGHMWMNQMPFLNASPGEWMLWTDEFSIDQSAWELTQISFHSSDGSPEQVKVAPAVRIDGQWYIGWDLRVETRRFFKWRLYDIQLGATGWVLFEPSLFFSVKDAAPVERLPDGDITAFGLYMFKDYAWYVNEIDNITLHAVPREPEDPYAAWVSRGYSQEFLRNTVDPAVFEPQADANGDGWANIWDFAMGRTSAEAALTGSILTHGENGDSLVMPWNEAASGLEIEVLVSRDLRTWVDPVTVSAPGGRPPLYSVYDDPDGNLYRSWQMPPIEGESPLFYRLQIDLGD
jgi:hypothetical protein